MEQNDLKQTVFANIFRVSNKIQAEGDKLSDELTLKQWFLLLILCRNGSGNHTVKDIAQQIGVTRQSAKKMLVILEKNAYISVEKSSSDGRALCICPTDKAYSFFKEKKHLGNILLDKAFRDISEDELSFVLRLLNKMRENLKEDNGAEEEEK